MTVHTTTQNTTSLLPDYLGNHFLPMFIRKLNLVKMFYLRTSLSIFRGKYFEQMLKSRKIFLDSSQARHKHLKSREKIAQI